MNQFIFDKEFKEKLNAVNEAAYRYFKIKAEYDEAVEKLHLLSDKQKDNNNERWKLPMKLEMKKFSIIILVTMGCFVLMGLSSSVNEGLRKMLNHLGLFDKILWSNGKTTTWEDIGGGTGNVTYPVNLAGGTETTGVLPESQGGRGTSTAQVAKINQVSGTGSTNVFTNQTVAGQGTDTSTTRINGVDISPIEKSYNDGLTGNIQNQFNAGLNTATSSASLRALITDETGTGSAVFSETPTINNGNFAGSSTTFPTDETTTGTKTITLAANSDFKVMTNGGKFRVSGEIIGSTTPRLLLRLATPIALGIGTVTPTVMATWKIPANTLGTNSSITFSYGATATASTGSSILVDIADAVGTTNVHTQAFSTFLCVQYPFVYFQNTGSTSTNVYGPISQSFGSTAQKLFLSTVNTAQDLNISVSLTGSSTTNLLWFEGILKP